MERLQLLLELGVPRDALAFYGRWWQLETWLREVAYLELRAAQGHRWKDCLDRQALSRLERDDINRYMASADADDLLAYIDVSHLLALIDSNWHLFEKCLLPKMRWLGAVESLTPIRNRNAHCRRPHTDDVDRLEQLLRDLEEGAARFYDSYVRVRRLDAQRTRSEPVATGWINLRHETARRLIRHAEEQYDVSFSLGYSVRPWADFDRERPIQGQAGVLWHATWYLRQDFLNLREFWKGLNSYAVTDSLIHLLVSGPSQVTVTFSAVDDQHRVADAIGRCFDSLLSYGLDRRADAENMTELWDHIRAVGKTLPSRVAVDSQLTDYDREAGYSLFGATRVPSR